MSTRTRSRGVVAHSRRIGLGGLALTLLLSGLVVGVTAPTPASAATLTVNSSLDEPDTTPGDGACLTSVGSCTLRAAIQEANAFAGADTISFAIAGTAPIVITPGSALPAITSQIAIDGYSQSGAVVNNAGVGTNAVYGIELHGAATPGVAGIALVGGSASSSLSGFYIRDFDIGVSVSVGGAANVVLSGNAVSNSNIGIRIDATAGARVGGGLVSERNHIFGTGTGIRVGGQSSFTGIRGNLIGTNRAGLAAAGNNYGVHVTDGSSVTVVGGSTPADRNVISGNNFSGILVQALPGDLGDVSSTNILGNYIGTGVTGLTAVPNGKFGIEIQGVTRFASNTNIGDGTVTGRNVISGNAQDGVSIWDSAAIGGQIRGNYIGVGADGVTPLGNDLAGGTDLSGVAGGGIAVRNFASNWTIGGNVAGSENVIANNLRGVVLYSGTGNRVLGNSIHDNVGLGIELGGIGANDPGDGDTGANNGQNYPTITAWKDATVVQVDYAIDSSVSASAYPITVDFFEADDAVGGEGKTFLGRAFLNSPDEVTPVHLGIQPTVNVGDPIVAVATDVNGNSSMFSPPTAVLDPFVVTSNGDGPDLNVGDGFCAAVDGCTLRAAIQQANFTAGIDIVRFQSVTLIQPSTPLPVITDPIIIDGFQGNLSRNVSATVFDATLAVTLSGTSGGSGLEFAGGSDGSSVRSLNISGWDNGVFVTSGVGGVGVSGNVITGNVIGVHLLGANSTLVGGTDVANRNVISGNSSAGVEIRGALGNRVQGNLIGTTANGGSSLPNGTGVRVTQTSSSNLIGGTLPEARNVISGNANYGVDIVANLADAGSVTNNTVYGNYIGVKPDGNSAMGNGIAGVRESGAAPDRQARDNYLSDGTPGSGNVISGNGLYGIELRDYTTGAAVMGSKIGVGADGTTSLPNGFNQPNSAGIFISGINNNVGFTNPGYPNIISGSAYGVLVQSGAVLATGNNISGNTIAGAVAGIQLDNGAPNDAGDPDVGANLRQNHPTLTASVTAGFLMANVTLDSLITNAAYPVNVQFFEADGVGSQGTRFLSSTNIGGPGTSAVNVGPTAGVQIAPGDQIVATVTDANGNTSPFSPAVTVGPIADTATFTNYTPGADFGTAANWDTGLVPGPLDTVIIPVGADVTVAAEVSVARLVVQGTLSTVDTGIPFTLTVAGVATPSIITNTGELTLANRSELSLAGDLTVNGLLQTEVGSKVTTSANLTIGGSGVWRLGGEFSNVSPGTFTSVADSLAVNVADTATVVATSGTTIDVITTNWTDNGGHYLANPGSWITFTHDLVLAPTSVMETRIIGSSITGANYGAFEMFGTLTRAGQFKVTLDSYTPADDDEYFAVYCGNCFGGAWNSTSAQPLELHYSTTLPSPNRIILRTVPNKVLPDGPGLQGLGASIDVDGDWAIVGQTNGLSDTPLNRAVIYHYNNITDTWDQIQTIQGPAGFVFGEDVAIDGNWIAITSRGPGAADDTTVVYNRLAAGPFTNLVGSVPGAGAVAIDHTMMVVGDPEGGTTGGLKNAFVYRLDSFGINTEQVLWPHGSGAAQFVDSYGSDVAVWYDPGTDQGTIAVGAPEPGATAGRVYVFTRGPSLWNADPVEILSEIDSGLGPDSIDQYGWSVAVSPGFLAVGHRLLDAPLQDQGGVWVYSGAPGGFQTNGGELVRASNADVSDTFGASVALEGNRLIVGAPTAQRLNHPQRDGAVYLFENVNDIWEEIDIRRAPDGESFDLYGSAVATSGSVILVGAAGDANDQGLDAGAFYSYGTTPLTGPTLAFDLQVATGSPTTVEVAPSGLAVTLFDRTITAARAASNIAASSISDIGVDDTALAAVTIQSIPLRSVVLNSAPLRSVPLIDIEITQDGGGGWPALLAGTELANKPLNNITFGEALADPVVDQRIAALPLRSVNVDGTPLRSVPIAAIALGETKLRSVPLRSVANGEPDPWCAIIADLLAESQETCDVALDHLTVLEITLRGVSIDAAPLRSVPLRSVDINGTPLRSVPLRSVELDASPLRSVPLRSVPLRSVPLQSVMLGNTSLADTLIDDTPLRSVVIEGLSVDGTPLRSVPLRSVPLRSVDLTGSPLRSVPLRSVPLRSVPLRSVELYASPLRSVPLRSVDIEGSALANIPLRSVALATSPLRSVPLRSVPLTAIPLRSVPLRSVDIGGTPLRSVPLRSVDVLGSPLRSVPLRSVTLLGVAVDCNKVNCDVDTLGDAYAAGAVSGDTTLGEILAAADGISLGELAPYFTGFGATEIIAALELGGFTLADLTSLDGITLGDLPKDLPELANMTLGDLGAALAAVTYGDLIGNAINPATGQLFTLEDLRAELDVTNLTIADLVDVGNLTMGDLFDAAGGVTIGQLGSLLDLISVEALGTVLAQEVLAYLSNSNPTITLGGLTPEEFGKLTLGDIAGLMPDAYLGDLIAALSSVPGLLDGYTLDDLLLALVDPGSLAQSPLPFSKVNVAALPQGAVGATEFSATFTLTSGDTRNVAVEIAVPGSATYVANTAVIGPTPIEPTITGNTLQWNFTATPGVPYDIRFGVLPTLRLGSTSLNGIARVVGTDVIEPASATVTVAEGIEPNDFEVGIGGARQTTPAVEDSVYLTYVSTPTDIDVFEINVAENDRLVAQLSNLDADLDMYLWRRADNSTAASALAQASDQPPLFSVTDPDAAAGTAEPLADFPRLDQLDPTLQLVATSNATGTKDESINTDRLPAGTYFVEVVGANGASTVAPAALQLKVLEADARPACRATAPLPTRVGVPAAPSIAAEANTLILVNPSRLEQLYGTAGRTTVQTSIDALTTYLAGAGAALNIVPAVVPVDAYPSVRAAYDHWDGAAGACDPAAANAVVAAINTTIIDPHREQFEHIVVLGGDELIPMARLDDNTGIANEYDYRHELDGKLVGGAGRNAASASFWDSKILSDEPYGESSARSLGDRFLYVSDAALGRVVETPTEIAAALDTFVQFRGTLAIDTAAVLGYDFLSDGSSNVADALSAGGVPTVDRDLADGFDAAGRAWDRLTAEEKINALTGNALVSLNAHFDHYRALPAVGDKVAGFTDNLIAADLAADVAPAASLVQSLVFSMGCHSGFSASDILIGSTNADWAQELGQDGALFVGNTGFGYGDTKTVAYSEHLMELFAQQVTSPLDLPSENGAASSTVGQALTWAKNAYIAQLQTLSVYDEKALQESTFYGLPFYRVGLPADPLPVAPTRRAAPDATGTPATRTVVDTSNQPRLTDAGLYFANADSGVDQTIVAPGRPIQPKAVRDVSVVSPNDPTVLDQQAIGAIVLGMTSTYQSVPNPVIATPEFDQAGDQAEAEVGEVAFPSKPLAIATTTGAVGERQQLVLATGQYRSDTQTQRLDDSIDVVVYYADASNTDHTLPTIGAVDSNVVNGRLAISLTATDTLAGSGVDRVYVLIAQNPGAAASTWTGIDLVKVAGTDRWSGSLALAPGTTNVEFLVQAKDDAGNVGVASNKATNFADDLQPAPVPPAAPPSVLTASAPTAPPSGSYAGPVTVQVTSTEPVTVTIDGVTSSLPSGATGFIISGDGTHDWSVTSLAGYTKAGTVTIDGTAPTVTVDRAPGVVPSPTVVKVAGDDAGSGVTSIRYSLSGAQAAPFTTVVGQSVLVALSAEGTTTITAEAFDAAGNPSGLQTFVYEVNGTPPVVTGVLSATPNDAGWINTPVAVTWSVDDPDANVPETTSVLAQGSMKITSGPSCDLAGNCATGTVTLKVDYTAPVLTLSTDRLGNTFDWNNTPVRVLSTCGPDVSGISCPTPIVVSTNGAGQTVPVSVQDVAGNVTSKTSRVINIDQVPPTLTWNAPANGAIVNTFTRPTCSASDGLSGLNGACAVEVSEPVSLTGYNQYTATTLVADKAGNTSSLTSTWKVKMDLNPPNVVVTETAAPNSAGWWKSAVTFSFTCTDVSPGMAVGGCPAPVTKDAEGAGQTVTVTATDLSGNDNIVSFLVNIDLTAPTITATAPTSVGLLDTVTVTCAATDALSGINFAASNCTDRTFPASQLTPGPNVFTFSATDIAGNTSTVTKTVTLVVPVNPAPTVRADMGVAGLNDIGFKSNIVILTGSYADPSGPGPYTASVRWTATGPFTPLILANDGSFVAAWIYGSAGTRTATVRICDAQGACGTDDLTVRTGVTQKITPVRECVVDRGAATNPRYVARWGYNNPATFAIAVPSIPLLENTFTSSPYLRGQPQIFLPGNQRGVFTTTFSSGTHAWKINGTTASATTTSPRC
ncbi:MAG: pre-peptidase C-terminal domain-containing protein [Actinobacteria bacterium]|nr:pre-peptidase C-terminal domain-containing protein [Actinomycetota bacterium]